MQKNRNTTPATLAAVTLSLIMAAAPAAFAGQKKATPAPAKKAPAAPQQYECQKCHMRYPADMAKKDKFVDPMDGGKLVPVKASPAAPKKGSPSPKPMKM